MKRKPSPRQPTGKTRSTIGPAVLPARDEGTGPALLLVHGLLCTGEAFHLLAPSLKGMYRLIAPDLRGHGRSCHLPGPYDAETLAADLAPTLDALGLETVHLLGFSHGGAIAQVFARTHPDRVRSLILVSTYVNLQSTWRERLGGICVPPIIALLGMRRVARILAWWRTAGGGRRLSREAAALGGAMLEVNDSRRMARALWAARRFDSRDWLGDLQMPTLIVVGEDDAIVSPRQAQLLTEGIPRGALCPLPGGGHQLPLSHPNELGQIVVAWLHERELQALRGVSDMPSEPGTTRVDTGATVYA